MIKFGPSGTGQSFLNEGFSKTIQAPKWLSGKNLDCYEYSFGKGVLISEPTARQIGKEFKNHNIEISVHAPYFINLATEEDQKMQNNFRYFSQTLNALNWFGGKRCVFHSGSPLKTDRGEAMKRVFSLFENILQAQYDAGLDHLILCPETMGKQGQLGTLQEVIELCKMAENVVPCIDFGHINARTQGSLKSADDYRAIFDELYASLGEKKAKNIHIHFSKIEYSKGGEVRHLTFKDKIYGPEFEPLAQVIKEFNAEPYIICESADTQTEDAIFMKNIFNQ